MSSFTSKRTQRATKAAKSFIVNDDGKSSSSTTQAASAEDKAEDTGGHSSVEVSHRELYLGLPTSLEIRRDNVKGRGLYAKKPFKRGAVILAQRPSVISLSNLNLESHCGYCAQASTPGSPLKRCIKCKTLRYCSSECQIADWAIHKHECAAIAKWIEAAPDRMPPTEAIRTLGRILWGRKVHGPDSTWWKEIHALQSHVSSLPPSATVPYTNLAHALVRYLGVASPDELAPYGLTSAGDIVDLISKFTTNTFTLTSPTLLPLGTCVSPTAALFNHSCRPNAVIVFPRAPNSSPEPKLHVIVIRDIPPGEEILTPYVDTTLPTKQRQDALKETYNFTCLCPVCSGTDKVVEPREAVLCPKRCGGLCPAPFTPEKDSKLIPWRCISCKESYAFSATNEVDDRRRLGQDALDKATKIQFSDPVHALKLATNLSTLLSSHLPPSAHPLLALLRLQQSLLVDSLSQSSDLLDDTIRVTAHIVSGFTALLDEGHPVRGIALAELGKLLAIDEPSIPASATAVTTTLTFPPTGPQRLNLALETLKRALGELMIGFGERGETAMRVREEVVRLEKEMSVWRERIRHAWQDSVMERGGGT